MTEKGEEKDNRTEKERKIDAILEAMTDWDFETLLGFAQDERRQLLETLDDNTLDAVHQMEVLGG